MAGSFTLTPTRVCRRTSGWAGVAWLLPDGPGEANWFPVISVKGWALGMEGVLEGVGCLGCGATTCTRSHGTFWAFSMQAGHKLTKSSANGGRVRLREGKLFFLRLHLDLPCKYSSGWKCSLQTRLLFSSVIRDMWSNSSQPTALSHSRHLLMANKKTRVKYKD